jgi:hypothetical protein
MTQSERHALQQLSITEWEHGRIRRADDLARALAGLLDCAAALPQGCPDIHHQLACTAADIRSQLHSTFTRCNPLRPASSTEHR